MRVNDLPKMLVFYRDVVGLEVWREFSDCVFFRTADGVEGHPQALVLFDRNVEVDRERSTIDHFAFVIGLEDYDERRRQLEGMGVQVRLQEFPRFHWRSLFVCGSGRKYRRVRLLRRERLDRLRQPAPVPAGPNCGILGSLSTTNEGRRFADRTNHLAGRGSAGARAPIRDHLRPHERASTRRRPEGARRVSDGQRDADHQRVGV